MYRKVLFIFIFVLCLSLGVCLSLVCAVVVAVVYSFVCRDTPAVFRQLTLSHLDSNCLPVDTTIPGFQLPNQKQTTRAL